MTSTPPPRSRVVRMADVVIGIILAVIAAMIGLIMLTAITQLSGLGAADQKCGGVPVDGLRCSPQFLNAMIVVGLAIVIFAWFVPTGIMVVRFLRQRLGWFLPLISFAVMVAGYYVVALVLGSSYLPAG